VIKDSENAVAKYLGSIHRLRNDGTCRSIGESAIDLTACVNMVLAAYCSHDFSEIVRKLKTEKHLPSFTVLASPNKG
jgi:hypothetical protein